MASEIATPVAEPRGRSRRSAGQLTDTALLLSFIVLLALWEIIVRVFNVPIFVVPAPSSVAASLWTMASSGLLFTQFLVTFTEAAAGFAIALVVAAVFAVVMTEWRRAERLLYPYFTALCRKWRSRRSS
jgi:NitT/TauT family transport system permease protein